MGSDEATTSTEGSGTFDPSVNQETQETPILSQEKRDAATTLGIDLELPHSSTGEDENSTDHATAGSSTENDIEVLKRKISELEDQAKRGLPAPEVPDSGPETTRPDALADMNEYERMEECLYKHRKEWEGNDVPKNFTLGFEEEAYALRSQLAPFLRGPCLYKWNLMIRETNQYKRPNPFDPSHKCIHVPGDANEEDEFDHSMDYGAARDRLRKNFEWDMDRMFLAEEMEIRKRAKVKEQNLSQQEKAVLKKKAETEAMAQLSPAQLKLNRQDWLAFKRLSQSDESHSCVIDVLVGEPVITDNVGRGPYAYLSGRVRKVDKLHSSKAYSPVGGPLPERIRVHSAALRKIMSMMDPTWIDDKGPTFVFVRPFKILFHHERALRSWCTELEQKFDEQPQTTGLGPATTKGLEQNCNSGKEDGSSKSNNASEKMIEAVPQAAPKDVKEELEHENETGDGETREGAAVEATSEDEEEEVKVDPNDISMSKVALDHLRCLLTFLDTEILARQRYLHSSECRKVFFSDLWYLFRPGMEVIECDGKQAYRIIKVTNPRHRVVPAWQAWHWGLDDKKKKAPFSVTCVYIDFDGQSLGPVSKTFDFKRFDGEMEATSLPIYPLGLHHGTRSDFSEAEWLDIGSHLSRSGYRQKLINRGKKFLEVVGTKPMYYAGPTLGIRDEVESQVVIDFETAFSVDDQQQQKWKPKLEVLLGNPSSKDANVKDENDSDTEEDDDGQCHASCCRGESVLNDSHIDDEQRSEYVNSLLTQSERPNEPPSIAILPQSLGELRRDSGTKQYSISDDERVIMSYRVFGFILRSRQWGKHFPFHAAGYSMVYTDVANQHNWTCPISLIFIL